MRDAAAAALGIEPAHVAVAETGTIGVPLDIDAVLDGVRTAAGGSRWRRRPRLQPRDHDHRPRPKRCTVELGGVTLSAQAKGAGMMEPGFATMLCFVQTDAVVRGPAEKLRDAVAGSFERITVDGQMSTNDTVLLQATARLGQGAAGGAARGGAAAARARDRRRRRGRDEGRRAEVTGAAGAAEAEAVARAIANSPLVKTALYGRDSNWGRIAQAAGMALAGKELEELGPDRIEARDLASDDDEAELRINLGRGKARAHVFFSDLTPDYVKLNAEYTT